MDEAVRRRLASDMRSVRAGALWERWLEAWLEARGAMFERHPEVDGLTRRPDLLAVVDGDALYVEATATGGGDLLAHRQPTPSLRLHDVLMSRLKHKSRAFQGIDDALLLAVLCVSDQASEELADGVLAELFDPANEAGRNVSGVLLGWELDGAGRPRVLRLRAHPRPLRPLPEWIQDVDGREELAAPR